jgi:prepilin-type N-terminal cleavage/methylation domain-containing protein
MTNRERNPMLERLKQKRTDEGFTLIELLIVIIILAILAAIVVFAVGTTTKNASVAACKSTAKSVETAVEAYKAQTGAFPGSVTVLVGTSTNATGTTVGPWLRQKPPAVGSAAKYAITTTSAGKVTVTTPAKTGTAHTFDTTAGACSAA